VAAAVAALVVVAGAGGGALWSTVDREARTASTTDLEVPYPGMVPRRIDDIASDLDVTTDLELGRGSAAFVSRWSDPVVVTATDGVAHRLALPGWEEDDQGLALSPDGLKLAWHDMSSVRGATIGVLDLMTGEATSHDVDPDDGLRLRELTWSPDSVWLAWLGDGEGGARVGRLRPTSAPMSHAWFVGGNIPDVTISNDARLVISKAGGGIFGLQGDDRPLRLVDGELVGAGSFSPDGAHVALRSGPGAASFTLDMKTRKVLRHPFPDDTIGAAVVRPLGWTDDGHQLLLVQETSGSGDGELVLTTPEVSGTSTWRRSVGGVEGTVASSLSVAVDLVPDLDGSSSQELTHEFPQPPERDISWIIGLGVAAAIAVLMGLRWLWRRLLG
jgi:hypothetical protein